ncbi:MAG TPA: hypothetical protein VGU19_00060 [Microvirga sp.]|nr:hypothetical protein [Microvirga sp.]
MSLRTCAVVLAVTAGFSAASATQAAQIANGLATNGLTINGLTINGNDVQGGRHDGSLSKIRLKAVILQDGSSIDLR